MLIANMHDIAYPLWYIVYAVGDRRVATAQTVRRLDS